MYTAYGYLWFWDWFLSRFLSHILSGSFFIYNCKKKILEYSRILEMWKGKTTRKYWANCWYQTAFSTTPINTQKKYPCSGTILKYLFTSLHLKKNLYNTFLHTVSWRHKAFGDGRGATTIVMMIIKPLARSYITSYLPQFIAFHLMSGGAEWKGAPHLVSLKIWCLLPLECCSGLLCGNRFMGLYYIVMRLRRARRVEWSREISYLCAKIVISVISLGCR